MKLSHSSRSGSLFLLLTLLPAAVAVILCFSVYWVSTDAAVYLPAARYVAQGHLPYRDFVHHYTPFVLMIHAAIWKIWPAAPYGVFVYLQQAVVLAGAFLCFRLAIRTFGHSFRTSLAIAILYYLSVLAQEGSLLVLEPWVLLFVWLAFSLFFGKGKGKYIGAGICIAFAFFCKQYGVLYLLPLLLYLGIKKQGSAMLQLLGGAALPVLLALGILWILKIPLSGTLEQLLASDHQQLNTEGVFTWYTFLIGGKVWGWLLLLSTGMIMSPRLYKEHPALFYGIISGTVLLLLPTLFRHFPHYFLLPLPFLLLVWMVALPVSTTRKSIFLFLAVVPISLVFFIRTFKNKDTYMNQKADAAKVAFYAPVSSQVYTPVGWAYITVINRYTIPFAVTKGFAFVKLPFEKYEPLLPEGSFFTSEDSIPGIKMELYNQQSIYLYKKSRD